MSKPPKEIWCSTGLYYEYKTDWSEGEWSARPDFAAIKYVRADRIKELEAKLAQLTEHNKSQAKPTDLGAGLSNSVNDTAP